MTEVRTVARQIQQLEIYLNNLVSSLMRGELPVNLQPVTQIFDNAIAAIPPILDLPQARFIELYNDLPHLFTAYAIDVTLSEDSYHRQTNDILFHRFARGNYWIIPTKVELDKGWLVPNPLKGLSLDRMPSLAASFDRDIIPTSTNSSCVLVAPALVQILPIVAPLTWKLVERGKLTTTQVQQSAATTNVIESLVEKLVKLNDRILQIERKSVTTEVMKTLTDRQEQLQSISAKIIDQLATKQQEILSLKSELVQSSDRSSSQEREIAALKSQLASIVTNVSSNSAQAIATNEITSLKIDLEKLKVESQNYRRLQDKNSQNLLENIKSLVAQEVANLQPVSTSKQIETIDAEIINLAPPQSISSPPAPVVDANNIPAPFARIYNSGKADFLRAYMVSTASLIRKNGQMVELVEDNTGLYWVIPFTDRFHYLVPKIDFPNNDKYLVGLALLFDGMNDTTSFSLFKPAIVSITKFNMPKQWQLQQKGYLDPKLIID